MPHQLPVNEADTRTCNAAILREAHPALRTEKMSTDIADAGTNRSSPCMTDCSPSAVSIDLEQKFEDDFSKHLQKQNKKQQFQLSAVGALTGGVMGLAAAPTLLPGFAVAAIVGGAGGYQWAKRWGRKDRARQGVLRDHGNARSIGADTTSTKLYPSMRRLTYLVKWGRWQLLEYEDNEACFRAAIIDEVVREFSPWVQQLFLLKCQHGMHEGDAETFEVFRHLAPLFYFLQHRATMEATIQSAAYVGAAFDEHHPDAICADRCFIVFPSILETISMLDRLSESTHFQLKRAVSSRSKDSHPVHKVRHRQRLQHIVHAICTVLNRADVTQAAADRSRFDQSTLSENKAAMQDRTEADIQVAPVEVPPAGTENELGSGPENENEYFSVSEESEGEDTRPVGSPCSIRRHSSIVLKASGDRAASLKQRLQALPRGEHDHAWSTFDASHFDVRSGTYFADKRKQPSGPAMLELLNADLIVNGTSGPVMRATEHPDFFPAHHWKNGDTRFLIVQNWIFPPYQAVVTAAVNFDAPCVADPSCPQYRVWKRFLEKNDEERADMIKLIMSVEQGPWMVKHAAPKKPVLIGRRLKTTTHYVPDKCLEIVFDVSSGKSEAIATGIVMRGLKSVQLASATVLEAREEDELPESVLLCFKVSNVNTAQLFCNLEVDPGAS